MPARPTNAGRIGSANLKLPMPVWDFPVRLFHWLLVVLIAVSYFTQKYDAMRLHLISGYTILALLLFRIVWGFVGSDTARFGRFLRSPFAAFRHLRSFGRREPDTQIGHNEAGGWMVIVLLLAVAVQVGTGLFSSEDDVAGPLAKYITSVQSDRISDLHGLNFNILLGLMGLHVVAVIAYAVVKRHNLVRPMFTGKKRLPAATPAPRMGSTGVAAAILVVAGLLVWVLATRV